MIAFLGNSTPKRYIEWPTENFDTKIGEKKEWTAWGIIYRESDIIKDN